MMASAQVVETSVNTNNSPSQDYTTNPDDHSNHNSNIYYCVLRSFTMHAVNTLHAFFDDLSTIELLCIGEYFVMSLFTFCSLAYTFRYRKKQDRIKLNIKFKKAGRGKYWTKLSVLYMQF